MYFLVPQGLQTLGKKDGHTPAPSTVEGEANWIKNTENEAMRLPLALPNRLFWKPLSERGNGEGLS